MQRQIISLIAHALDMDGEKKSVSEKMVAYYNAEGNDTLYTFRFQPQPVNFEVIDRRIFAEVLYPKDIYDLIDHHIRECVKREVRMRVCKNCLRYFAVTGKASTEYCDRICDSKGRTCREIRGHQHMDAAQAGRRGVQGISQRVQKAFRPHQRRQADQERVLRLERGSQKEKRGLRQRHDHTGGFLPLAEGVLGKIKTSG